VLSANLTTYFFYQIHLLLMRKFTLLLASVLLFCGGLTAQHRHCAAEEVYQQQLLNDPQFRENVEAIERHAIEHALEMQNGAVGERIVVTIPVVFNVVWNTTAENISDARLLEQLQVLNDDFRKLNADQNLVPAVFQPLHVDCEINFCLATRDPSGNATTGIRRQFTNTTAFSTNDAVKFTAQGGLDGWDRNSYLNFWVCDLSGGLLGYAQFPGGAAATDGVVCDYAYTGVTGASAPFNKGRTATHEVGHWLNLRHIWGDANCGNDLVSDTPTQQTSNGGCPTFPKVTCSNGPNGDMFMNYMDYTNDACMYMFTAGQKARMQALFAAGGSRAALLNSLGCSTPGGGGSCAVPTGLNATSITQSTATLNWGAVSGATSYNLQWKAASASGFTTVSGIPGATYNLTGLTAGTNYNYQVQAVCSGGSSAYSTTAAFTTQSSGTSCADIQEANDTRAAAKNIIVNTNYTAQIATSTDVDWYKFGNTSTNRNIKVDVTTLPFDYDVKLFRSSTQVGISQNPGTTNELIILNNATVSSNYTINVYGYQGANSNTQCYTFRVSLSSTAWRTDGTTDGNVTELEIPMLEEGQFGLYPNPAESRVIVDVPLTADNDVQVTILDATGKAAAQQNRFLSKGDNLIEMDLSKLVTGVYFVQVRNGDSIKTRKLVIQK
jgi:Pregnancy-associated plasma protein-A/Secretion system C-terminal sorting domain/Fibronectin type III domain